MNILIAGADYYGQTGGKATHILMLKSALEEYGHLVKVMFPRRNLFTKLAIGGGGKILDLFGAGIIYRQFIIKSLLKNSIKKFLERNKADIVNVEDIIAFFSVFELKKNLPVILTMHGELAQEMESAGHIKSNFEKNHFLRLEKTAYEKSAYIVAVDTRLKNHIENLAPQAKLKPRIIQNFIDVEMFRKKIDLLNEEEVKKELKIDFEKKIILVPRRLVLKCGVIYALKAVEILRDRFNRNDLFLVIAGDGPERKSLLRYIEKNNLRKTVFLSGSVEYKEMVKYYKIADIVLVPSIDVKGYQEATSLSVLEAMAAKIPVIASDLGGLAELIDNGVTGILVPEKSSEDIADSIIKLLDREDIKDNIVKAAFSYVSKNHSNKIAALKFIEIYKNEIDKNGR